MQEENDKIFIAKWFSSLIAVWYISVGLSWYYPKTLEMLYWPLHTHDIEIDASAYDGEAIQVPGYGVAALKLTLEYHEKRGQ